MRCRAPWAVANRHALPGFRHNGEPGRDTTTVSEGTISCFNLFRRSFHADEPVNLGPKNLHNGQAMMRRWDLLINEGMSSCQSD